VRLSVTLNTAPYFSQDLQLLTLEYSSLPIQKDLPKIIDDEGDEVSVFVLIPDGLEATFEGTTFKFGAGAVEG